MQHILGFDIGGTNCRLGHFLLENGMLRAQKITWLRTAEIARTDDLLHAAVLSTGLALQECSALVAALAGPVSDPLQGRLTNAPVHIDLRSVSRQGVCCKIINDFTAQALACLMEPGERARRLLGANTSCAGNKAVLGAGTGMGTASLVRDSAGQWLPVPAEGGHAAFPFVGREEMAFQDFLCTVLGSPYACGDDVLTGRGLCLLHRFLTGQSLEAPQIGAEALCRETETLCWYARFYGRACRNWLLTTLCTGGLYIAGGIAAHNPRTVTCVPFRDAFFCSSRCEDLLRRTPVFLMEDRNSGLWGAARMGMMMLEQREGMQ